MYKMHCLQRLYKSLFGITTHLNIIFLSNFITYNAIMYWLHLHYCFFTSQKHTFHVHTGINKALGHSMNEQHSNEQRQHSEEGSNKYCNCLDAVHYDEQQLMIDVVEDEATCNGARKVAQRHQCERPWHGCCVTVEQSLHMYDRCANQRCTHTLHIACIAVTTSSMTLLDRDGHETSMAETETRRLQVSRRYRDVEVHVYCH